jgi:hypothetical protein
MTYTPPTYDTSHIDPDVAAHVQAAIADLAKYVDAQIAAALPPPVKALLSPFQIPSPAIPTTAYYVDPTGSDTGSGSSTSPWKTIEHAVSVVKAGDVVVLNGGGAPFVSSDPKNPNSLFFSAAGTAAAPIKWISNPAKPRAQLQRRQRMNGAYNQFWNFDITGPTGVIGSTEDVLCWMDGGVWLVNCDVSKGAWHAGCFVGNASIPTKILGCRIHHNGSMLAANANVDHGIYWNVGGGLIAGSLLDHNYCHGVQFYPHTNGGQAIYSTFASNGNTVGGTHGVGLMFATDGTSPITQSCTADHCIFDSNVENGVRTSGVIGAGCSVSNSNFHGNGSGNYGAEAAGLTLASNNTQLDPLFTDAANGKYDLQPASPCIAAKQGAYQNGQDPATVMT